MGETIWCSFLKYSQSLANQIRMFPNKFVQTWHRSSYMEWCQNHQLEMAKENVGRWHEEKYLQRVAEIFLQRCSKSIGASRAKNFWQWTWKRIDKRRLTIADSELGKVSGTYLPAVGELRWNATHVSARTTMCGKRARSLTQQVLSGGGRVTGAVR